MENYELYVSPVFINPVNGRFRKGHIPFNKGIPTKEWMDGRKKRKVLKCLEIGRKLGNKHLAGSNRKKVIAIKDNQMIAYLSAGLAERILRQKGIRINQRNINKVCHGDDRHRIRAGGYQWFFADDIEKYKDLIVNN